MDNLRATFKINHKRIAELEEAIQTFRDSLTDAEQAVLSYIQFPGVYLHKRDEMKRVMAELSLSRSEFIAETRRIRSKATICTVVYEACKLYEESPESFDDPEDYRVEMT